MLRPKETNKIQAQTTSSMHRSAAAYLYAQWGQGAAHLLVNAEAFLLGSLQQLVVCAQAGVDHRQVLQPLL
jgi:hypothetical protein